MTWQAGDLALCIKLGPWMRHYSNGVLIPLPGVSKVRGGGIYAVIDCYRDEEGLFLIFEEGSGELWKADRFVKVTPPAVKQTRKVEQTA